MLAVLAWLIDYFPFDRSHSFFDIRTLHPWLPYLVIGFCGCVSSMCTLHMLDRFSASRTCNYLSLSVLFCLGCHKLISWLSLFILDPCDVTTHGLVVAIHGLDFVIVMHVYMLFATTKIGICLLANPLPALPLPFALGVTTWPRQDASSSTTTMGRDSVRGS